MGAPKTENAVLLRLIPPTSAGAMDRTSIAVPPTSKKSAWSNVWPTLATLWRSSRLPPEPCLWRRQQEEFVAWSAFVSFLLEKFGSGPRRSLRRSAERPARAAWAALRLLAAVAIGATMELGRSWRTLLLMLLLRPRGAGEPRGHRQTGGIERAAL